MGIKLLDEFQECHQALISSLPVVLPCASVGGPGISSLLAHNAWKTRSKLAPKIGKGKYVSATY
jgi:hypothetical protein